MSAVDRAPWDVDPALKPKRLLLLARLAVETRDRALAEANREEGDTNWGIGCKAHERFVHAVAKLAEGSERSWLRVHKDGLSFVSMIEGVAIRAYRGFADKPDARHVFAAQLDFGREAIDPRQMAFDFGAVEPDPDDKWAWLMAVETDAEGRALRVVFFQANAVGSTRNAWIAPVASVRASAEATQATLDVAGATSTAPRVIARRARRGKNEPRVTS